MKIQMYKHQIESYMKIFRDRWVLNASEPGTGKTASCIKLIEEHSKYNAVIICPAFVSRNWKAELSRFADIESTIYPVVSRVTIISADMVHKAESLFKSAQIIIMDEAHFFTNINARRTKAMHEFLRNKRPEYFVMLTGTPYRNHIPELYSLLSFIDYGRPRGFLAKYPSQFNFSMYFCHKVEVPIGGGRSRVQFKGCRNLDAIKSWIRPVTFRYKLEELEDIPDIIETNLEVDASIDSEMEFLMGDSIDGLLERGWECMALSAKPPDQVASAKSFSASMKAPSTAQIAINEFEASQSPIIVFSDHRAPVRMLEESLSKYRVAVITGDTSMPERDRINKAFQEGEYDFLLGTIRAMGTGLTFTRSHTCIFNDLSWDPAQNEQAIGRIRRISQKADKCRVLTVSRVGIDSRINQVLREKTEIARALVS